MSYFLSSQKLELGKIVSIQAEEARHMLLARRMKVGGQVVIQGQDGKRFETKIVEIKKNLLKVEVLAEVAVPPEWPVKISLFQSVVSEKALDFIFQKATELGAAGITIFNSEHTATKLTIAQFKKKEPRWQKIFWEAAKQCGRGKVPELKFLLDVNQVIDEASNFDQNFILNASGKNLNQSFKTFKSCSIIIGPEGGFTQEELKKLKAVPKTTVVNISPFTLRAETAAIAGLAIIQAQL